MTDQTMMTDQAAQALLLGKPKLRGVLHQCAAWCAGLAGIILAAFSPTPRALVATGIYALSLVALFSISATYHRVTWTEKARAWMRRLDHAAIFILIAGTATPLALLGLPASEGNTLFLATWAGAVVGVLVSVFWVKAPKVIPAALAVALGWMMTPYLWSAYRTLGTATMVLLVLGGLAYTIGAIAYAAKRPNPVPGIFGYHEVFHALTIVAAVLHFIAVARIAHGFV